MSDASSSNLAFLYACRVVVLDNLDNSSEEAVKRVAELSGKAGENLSFFLVCCSSIIRLITVVENASHVKKTATGSPCEGRAFACTLHQPVCGAEAIAPECIVTTVMDCSIRVFPGWPCSMLALNNHAVLLRWQADLRDKAILEEIFSQAK